MQSKYVEVTNGSNWGKFMVSAFDPADDQVRSALPGAEQSLIAGRGWTSKHVLVFDLETGEGAMFFPGGSPRADLDKHAVWVCPMFEPFLEWLYERADPAVSAWVWVRQLPSVVELPDAPFALAGYRRAGLVDLPAQRGDLVLSEVLDGQFVLLRESTPKAAPVLSVEDLKWLAETLARRGGDQQ